MGKEKKVDELFLGDVWLNHPVMASDTGRLKMQLRINLYLD
ncbi:hypothetical protein HMPREF1981_01519 [Bacteroides pyogenes F0041]|uniref:Uncharacterized protein n=1 Tax=Bacteroides pyogenes F0041 TaxID=1321819 RepID=U2C588_9BACE|nr:hypothetical protein HMPREF1981_01519 [Bacteroides pyogenes F0041]